jgi:hypothetical protein
MPLAIADTLLFRRHYIIDCHMTHYGQPIIDDDYFAITIFTLPTAAY